MVVAWADHSRPVDGTLLNVLLCVHCPTMAVVYSTSGFTVESYAVALSVAVPLLALMGALSLIVEEAYSFFE